MKLRRPSWRLFSLAQLAVIAVFGVGQVIAGNGWNAPPKPGRPPEPAEERAGAEFFKLEAQIYATLGSVEEGDFGAAGKVLQAIPRQFERSMSECQKLGDRLKTRPDLDEAYKAALAVYDEKSRKYIDGGMLASGDPSWPSVARGGFDNLVVLCSKTIGELQAAFKPIAASIEKKTKPPSPDAWKLMFTLETSSKRSRYFTMILRP